MATKSYLSRPLNEDESQTLESEPPSPPSLSGHAFNGLRNITSISKRQLSPSDAKMKTQNDARRDSGLAPSSSTTRGSHTTLETDLDSSSSLRESPTVQISTFDNAHTRSNPRKTRRWNFTNQQQKDVDQGLPPVPRLPFLALTTEIPTSSMEDLTLPGQVEFTQRGSILIGGKKANHLNNEDSGLPHIVGSRRKPSISRISPLLAVPSRLLSTDDEILSREVRSMYDSDTNRQPRKEEGSLSKRGRNGDIDQYRTPSSPRLPTIIASPTEADYPRKPTALDPSQSAMLREDNELAGGTEDWEDVNGGDVDRYGFILQRRVPSRGSTVNSPSAMSPEPTRLQRTSTALQVASEVPRRQRSKDGRTLSSKSPARSASAQTTSRPNSRLDRPASSQSSYRGSIHATQSKIRSAANRLPHNKDRRCVDEAGDMLTLPPGLADIAENDDDCKAGEALRRREWEREGKWRKMAKVAENSRNGGGMVFEFDTTSSKLIERTWKGIPDRWRATAWHAFLTASAKKRGVAESDEQLISIFKQLLKQGSPDDVQIDIDVPRTINCHIMFRKRYRGGQRLLFRVLHCMSIYFPDTGYVQGMAALAATLLCYFDEEMAFVMLVRLWQLRGLERLYQAGFEGLMKALDEFESSWLAGGEVAARLVCLLTFTLHDPCLLISRPSSVLAPQPTAPAGISRSSTTRSPSQRNSGSGMSSCSLETPKLVLQSQPLPKDLTPRFIEALMSFTLHPQPSSTVRGRFSSTPISRTR